MSQIHTVPPCTVPEVAKALGVSARRVQQLARLGSLGPSRYPTEEEVVAWGVHPRAIIFDRTAVEGFLARRKELAKRVGASPSRRRK